MWIARIQPVALTGAGGNLPAHAEFQAAMPANDHSPRARMFGLELRFPFVCRMTR
jgi:hypothetical protein